MIIFIISGEKCFFSVNSMVRNQPLLYQHFYQAYSIWNPKGSYLINYPTQQHKLNIQTSETLIPTYKSNEVLCNKQTNVLSLLGFCGKDAYFKLCFQVTFNKLTQFINRFVKMLGNHCQKHFLPCQEIKTGGHTTIVQFMWQLPMIRLINTLEGTEQLLMFIYTPGNYVEKGLNIET